MRPPPLARTNLNTTPGASLVTKSVTQRDRPPPIRSAHRGRPDAKPIIVENPQLHDRVACCPCKTLKESPTKSIFDQSESLHGGAQTGSRFQIQSPFSPRSPQECLTTIDQSHQMVFWYLTCWGYVQGYLYYKKRST